MIPPEIVDRILSFLQSDPETLKVCSESDPLLSQIAEPHLLSRILLKTDGSFSHPQSFSPSAFANLLSERPHIVHHVRNLDIHVIAIQNTKAIIRNQLHEISSIIPKLSALRQIALSHFFAPTGFTWDTQPVRFRSAFILCLRLPSIREVSITHTSHFPLTAFLNPECSKSLERLTLRSCKNVVLHAYHHANGTLPFEYLCLQHMEDEAVIDWTASRLPKLRSLKFSSEKYHMLPKLFTGCSTTLMNLYIDIKTLEMLYYYNFKMEPPVIYPASSEIPVKFSMLPHLEELTIHSKLRYIHNHVQWGVYSVIPTITKLFSDNNSSSLKRLILDFDCVVTNTCKGSLPKFPPSFSVWDVVSSPLLDLVSSLSSEDTPPTIQVELMLNGNPLVENSLVSAINAMVTHFVLSPPDKLETMM